MEERVLTANEAGLLVNRAEEENRIKRWNFIINKIEMECLLHMAHICNFDLEQLNSAEIQRLRDLGYTVELIETRNFADYYMVSWPVVMETPKAEPPKLEFSEEDMKDAFT